MCSFPTKRHVEVELRSPREPPIHKPMPFPHLLPEIRLSVPLEGFLVRLLHPPEMRSSLPFSIFPALRRARLLNRKYSCFVPTLALACSPTPPLRPSAWLPPPTPSRSYPFPLPLATLRSGTRPAPGPGSSDRQAPGCLAAPVSSRCRHPTPPPGSAGRSRAPVVRHLATRPAFRRSSHS